MLASPNFLRFNRVAGQHTVATRPMNSPSERRRAARRIRFAIDVLTTIGIFIAVGVVIWRNWPEPPAPPIPLPVQPLAVAGAPSKGSAAAPLVVVMYSDFECPYCGGFARDTLGTLDRLYVASGKVRLVYRHTTPPNHSRALPSAVAAECAGAQGKFWEMHDRIFSDQTKLDDSSLRAHADALALDPATFRSCQADPAIADRIVKEASNVRNLRIGGTPAFFIGTAQADGRVAVTRTLRGAVPLAEFQEAVDSELGEITLAWLKPLQSPSVLVAAAVGGAALLSLGFWMRRHRRARSVAGDV